MIDGGLEEPMANVGWVRPCVAGVSALLGTSLLVTGVVGLATPGANAQVVAFTDPVGDGTIPAVDIVDYTAAVTSTVVGASMRVQSYDPDITGDARVTFYFEVTGDTEPDFRFERRPVDGSFWVYQGSGDTVVCKSFVSPSGAGGIEMFAPASCLGNPAQVRVIVYISSLLHGYDDAANWGTWLGPVPGDPSIPVASYTTPAPSPTASPTPTATPTSAPTSSPTPAPTSPTTQAPSLAVPDRVSRPKVVVRGHRAVVKWRVPDATGSPITGYRIDISKGRDRKVAATTRQVTFRRLSSGRYRFRVAALSDSGRSPYSARTTVHIQ